MGSKARNVRSPASCSVAGWRSSRRSSSSGCSDGFVYRVRGVDPDGLSHGQRQALTHRFEAGLRLLDEHCRVYQYLVKRIIDPIVSAPCSQPVANEAIQRRATYLNARREELYTLSLFIVLLYEAPHVMR